jgi:hypothetical protein
MRRNCGLSPTMLVPLLLAQLAFVAPQGVVFSIENAIEVKAQSHIDE